MNPKSTCVAELQARNGMGGKLGRKPSSEDLEAPLTDSGAGSPSSSGRLERRAATALGGGGAFLSEVQLNQVRSLPCAGFLKRRSLHPSSGAREAIGWRCLLFKVHLLGPHRTGHRNGISCRQAVVVPVGGASLGISWVQYIGFIAEHAAIASLLRPWCTFMASRLGTPELVCAPTVRISLQQHACAADACFAARRGCLFYRVAARAARHRRCGRGLGPAACEGRLAARALVVAQRRTKPWSQALARHAGPAGGQSRRVALAPWMQDEAMSQHLASHAGRAQVQAVVAMQG